MQRNRSRDNTGRYSHTEDHRNMFERARDNVRGWFRPDADDDRHRDVPDYAHHEERAGRADHQIFGGRGLQAYDDAREVSRDEQRRFGGGVENERSYSQSERDWFHHKNERSWASGDEPPRGQGRYGSNRGQDRYTPAREHRYGPDPDRRDYLVAADRDRPDNRAPDREPDRYASNRDLNRGAPIREQNGYAPDPDRRHYLFASNRDRPDAATREHDNRYRRRGQDDDNRYIRRGEDRFAFDRDNRYMRRDEDHSRRYDAEDDRSRSGDAFGRLKDDFGRYDRGPVARDERHRFADTDDDSRNNWRTWSGRASEHDGDRPYARDREHLARDERSRLAPTSDDDRYGHPSTRGNRLDYDQQFASNTERGDDNRASRTYGRDEDQDRSFIARDEYGRRRH